jgi:hypothetical protein
MEDNIKIDLKTIWSNLVNWIRLAQDMQCQIVI